MPEIRLKRHFSTALTCLLCVAVILHSSFVSGKETDAGMAQPTAVPTDQPTAAKPPNFLFIFADDQAPHTLGCYGNTTCQTPNIDRLAREGLLLHDARHMGSWSGAVCLPSRTMVMTGRSVWRIPGARGPNLEMPEGYAQQVARDCLAEIFNRAGYVTMRTCKNGNSFKLANEAFQVKRTQTKRMGTAEGGSQWHAEQVLSFLRARELGQQLAAGQGGSVELSADETAMLDEAGGEAMGAKPFLIYFGFSHPHDPRHALPELAEKYGARQSRAASSNPGCRSTIADQLPAGAPVSPWSPAAPR